VSRANWDAIPSATKQQAKAILANCTGATIPIKLSWDIQKSGTTNVWGFALYSDEAWVLRQKEQIDSNKLAQIRTILTGHGFAIQWTTNFWQDIDAAGLERIPHEEP
jgi:hypothetical protein